MSVSVLRPFRACCILTMNVVPNVENDDYRRGASEEIKMRSSGWGGLGGVLLTGTMVISTIPPCVGDQLQDRDEKFRVSQTLYYFTNLIREAHMGLTIKLRKNMIAHGKHSERVGTVEEI